jgi:hypothetical protein
MAIDMKGFAGLIAAGRLAPAAIRELKPIKG